VLHVAAVSQQVLEALVRDLLAELAVEHEVARAPAPVKRGDFSPHPRRAGECEAVPCVCDVREDGGSDALVDVESSLARVSIVALALFFRARAFLPGIALEGNVGGFARVVVWFREKKNFFHH
jgi:hypothetical protein